MANAPPQAAIALPPSITFDSIRLDTKHEAALQCSQVPSSGDSGYSDVLVVFLNGLVAPQSFWLPVMSLMLRHLKLSQRGDSAPSHPQVLAYDRYGQGKTIDRDPHDEGKEPGYGHDVLDVVRDLHQLVAQVTRNGPKPKRLLLVANSIGCAIARLYAQEYPGTVAGMLLLDSMMANTDFVSIFPDPDSADFDAGSLPSDVTPEMLRETRDKFRAVFHPSVRNPEGMDRRNLPALLPEADQPVLSERGYAGRSPLVTVVGHDPGWFAQESLKSPMATPLAMSMNYMNPTWHRYNEGLMKITSPDRAVGPLIAKNCGHFVQRDDPGLVAELACDMLVKLAKEGRAVSKTGSQARELSARAVDWSDKPKIKVSTITKQTQLRGPDPEDSDDDYDSNDVDTKKAEVYQAQINGRGPLLLKVFRQEHFLENEVDIYKVIDGEGIAPRFAALVTDDRGKVVGFLTEFIQGAHEADRRSDKRKCRAKLKKLHDAQVSLGKDFKTDNFLVRGDNVWIVDFEASVYTSDDDEFKEDDDRFKTTFG
ncbi:Uu.00g064110.m01.CDS01 [Anthostomella pinea]|uniref:Uu.00g064110.m01.CDS01 n=1 Tax=Anthostomella pinea TaxID=933095 RepID=A0AAI8VTH4_9PEZI|nr:Uu.00g064110.m01.CDS01 [Anthostomella pinea]